MGENPTVFSLRVPGNVGFDPLRVSEWGLPVDYLREAELKHGANYNASHDQQHQHQHRQQYEQRATAAAAAARRPVARGWRAARCCGGDHGVVVVVVK